MGGGGYIFHPINSREALGSVGCMQPARLVAIAINFKPIAITTQITLPSIDCIRSHLNRARLLRLLRTAINSCCTHLA